MPRIIRPLSPNPRIKNDDDATVARYGDLEWLYSYIMQQGGGGGGTSAITWKGTWSAATAYVKDDAVYYDGSSYICTTAVGPSASNPSVDVANWDVLALEGQQGAAGPAGAAGAAGPAGTIGPVGIAYRGGWSTLANYAQRDVVVYNGSAYICTVAINASANNPTVAIANWDLLVSKGAQGSPGLPGIPGPIGPVGPAGLNWQGLWSASGVYVADDAVGYGGASWFCINPVGPSVTPPDVDTVNWALLAAEGAQGDQGIQGLQGDPGDPGPQGPAGPPNTLVIGTVTSAASPSATITGTAPNQTLNLVLAKGDQGDPGPPGPPGSGSVVAGNAVYVSKSGNDNTGVRNNLGLSFLTINAALAAAQTGDTVIIFPGDYELTDQLVLKNNIHFHFLGVGTLTLLITVKKYIFDDSSSAGAVTCTIYAPNWKFEGRGSTRTDSTVIADNRGVVKGVLKLTKASIVDITAREIIAADTPIYIEGNEGTAVYPYNTYAGAIVPKVKITAHTIRKTADYGPNNPFSSVIGAQFAQLEINATDIIQDAPWTSYDQGGIDFRFCEKMIINADRIINFGEDGQCMYMQDSGPLDKLYLDVNYIRSGDGWTIWTFCGTSGFTGNIFPEVYIRANRIDNLGDCCVVSSYTDLTIEGTTIYNDYVGTDGILHCEFGGKLTAIGCKVLRSPGTTDGADVLASGTAEVFLLNTVFDRKKLFPIGSSTISIWNGTDYIKYKEVNISSAALQTFSTPVEILPVVATNQYYVIEKMILEGNCGTIPTSIGLASFIYVDSSFGTYTVATIAAGLLTNLNATAQENTYIVITPTATSESGGDVYMTSGILDTSQRGIRIRSGSNPTGITDQTLKIKVWYRVETKG